MHEEEHKSAEEVSESKPIVGHIREKFYQSETLGYMMRNDGFRLIETIEGYMAQKWFLDQMRSLEYLLK